MFNYPIPLCTLILHVKVSVYMSLVLEDVKICPFTFLLSRHTQNVCQFILLLSKVTTEILLAVASERS